MNSTDKALKHRFPTALLCITIVLAIAFTALAYPGYMLSLFGEKHAAEEQKESDIVYGNSKPISAEPQKGVRITAEENALPKDREVKFEELGEEKFSELAETLSTQAEVPSELIGAWEFDVGLKDDELAPGRLKLSFDLNELGIDEENYRYVSFYRIDAEGKWYEYATNLDGSVMSFETDQNCVITATMLIECSVALIILGPPIFDFVFAGKSGGYLLPTANGKAYVYVDNKKTMQINYDAEVLKETYADTVASKVVDITIKARERAEKELLQTWGKKDSKDKDFKKRRKELIIEYAKTLSKDNAELQRLKDEFERIKNNQKTAFDSADDSAGLVDIAKKCRLAYEYLQNSITNRMPSYVVRIELVKNAPANGVTISPFLGHPYCIIRYTGEDKPILLLTITHELYHACQRTWVWKTKANDDFDEALAQAVETDAYIYFHDKTGELKFDNDYSKGEDPKYKALDNYYARNAFAVEMDSSDSTSYPDGHYKTKTLTEAQYPWGAFIRYIKAKTNVSYDTIMWRYKSLLANGSFSKILRTAFNIDDQKLNEYYVDFVRSELPDFYRAYLIYTGSVCSPKEVLDSSKEITVQNKDYATRMRNVFIKKRSDSDKGFALVLKKSSDFDDKMSDMKLVPVKNTNNKDYVMTDYGFFFKTMKFDDGIENESSFLAWSIFEIDGGVGKSGAKSSYTLYPMYAPDKPTAALKDGKVTVTLPDPARSTAYGAADRYYIKIYKDNSVVGEYPVSFSELGSDRKWTKALSDIKLTEKDAVSVTVTEAVGNNKGPESEKVSLTNSSSSGYWKQVSAVTTGNGLKEIGGNYHEYTYTYAAGAGHYEVSRAEKGKTEVVKCVIDADVPPEKIMQGDTISVTATQKTSVKKNHMNQYLNIDIVVDAEINGNKLINGSIVDGKRACQTWINDNTMKDTSKFKISFNNTGICSTGKFAIVFSTPKTNTIFLYEWVSE